VYIKHGPKIKGDVMNTHYVDHSEMPAGDLVTHGKSLTRITDRYLQGLISESEDFEIDPDELDNTISDIWELNNLMKDVFNKLQD
jgi:hypothetical protein